MTPDPARAAAVEAALPLIRPDMTIGLGSGRAVFALVDALGTSGMTGLRAIAASPETHRRALTAGIEVLDLNEVTAIDTAFDGADEVDHELNLIKGGGAAALREKLLLAICREVVILTEEPKLVTHLGDTRRLPVDIAAFGWQTTQHRVLELTPQAELRTAPDGTPAATAEGNLILDVEVPRADLRQFGRQLKGTLGVMEHGLFLDVATTVLVGHADGRVTRLTR